MGNKRLFNILYSLNENGFTTEELRVSVIEMLKPFFTNQKNLIKNVFESEMLNAYHFLLRYHRDSKFVNDLNETLKIYKDTFHLYPNEVISMMLSILEVSAEKENQMWTVRENTPNLDSNDEFYDKVVAYMKHIGDTLEIGTKYIVTEIYALIKLIEDKSVDYVNIKKMSFGTIVRNILDQNKLLNVLFVPPDNLTISDWRNIAYHHEYKIKNELIICTYNKGKKTAAFSINEFEQQLHNIVRASNILNIARCIFVFDILHEFQKIKKEESEETCFRKSLLVDQMKLSILSQVFKLDKYEESDNEIVITILDLKNDEDFSKVDEQKRLIHSSQFLYRFWTKNMKAKVSIIYCNKTGKKIAKASINGEKIAILENLKIENNLFISRLAELVEFKFY